MGDNERHCEGSARFSADGSSYLAFPCAGRQADDRPRATAARASMASIAGSSGTIERPRALLSRHNGHAQGLITAAARRGRRRRWHGITGPAAWLSAHRARRRHRHGGPARGLPKPLRRAGLRVRSSRRLGEHPREESERRWADAVGWSSVRRLGGGAGGMRVITTGGEAGDASVLRVSGITQSGGFSPRRRPRIAPPRGHGSRAPPGHDLGEPLPAPPRRWSWLPRRSQRSQRPAPWRPSFPAWTTQQGDRPRLASV